MSLPIEKPKTENDPPTFLEVTHWKVLHKGGLPVDECRCPICDLVRGLIEQFASKGQMPPLKRVDRDFLERLLILLEDVSRDVDGEPYDRIIEITAELRGLLYQKTGWDVSNERK